MVSVVSVCQNVGEYVDVWKPAETLPRVLSHGDTCLVRYACTRTRTIGFDVVLEDREYPNTEQLVYRETWPCVDDEDKGNRKRLLIESYRSVLVKFPLALRFRPDLLNYDYFPHTYVKIRLWSIDREQLGRLDHHAHVGSDVYARARVRKEYTRAIRPPYSRPSMTTHVCLSFEGSVLYALELRNIYQCPLERGNLKIILIKNFLN